MSTSASVEPVSPAVIASSLLTRLDELIDELVRLILSGDHAYAESTRLSADLLHGAVRDNLDSILRQLAGLPGEHLAAATAAGKLKAGHGVPLAALLHAYRLGGRLIWDQLRAAGVANDWQDVLPD